MSGYWRQVEVTIERPTSTKDAVYGSRVPGWEPLVMVDSSPEEAERFPAMVRDALPSRSETVAQGLAIARNQTVMRIRYRSDIDSTMRVTIHLDSDQVFQIVGGPAEIGRKRWLELVLEKYSTSGGAA